MTFAAASVLSTSSMTYNSKTNTLTCEASDISLTPGRLYDDACDYGVWVKSHKTGKLEAFVYLGPTRDRDGDVVCWCFANTKHGVILNVYND